MIAPISRIIARWVGGILIGIGAFSPEDVAIMDTDLALAIGAALGILTEAAYALAVKKGWSK